MDSAALAGEHKVEMLSIHPHVASRNVVSPNEPLSRAYSSNAGAQSDVSRRRTTTAMTNSRVTWRSRNPPDSASDLRRRVGEIEEALELRRVTFRPPLRVVPVLLPPARHAPLPAVTHSLTGDPTSDHAGGTASERIRSSSAVRRAGRQSG
jgi:hypothetical protein